MGTKIHPFIPFSTIFDTPGCYKTHLLNKKVSSLALDMWFWSVFFCHLTPQPGQFLLVKINFKSSKWLLEWEFISSTHFLPFLKHLETIKSPIKSLFMLWLLDVQNSQVGIFFMQGFPSQSSFINKKVKNWKK